MIIFGKRFPLQSGFNIPTFKQLDVLSLEGEWFGSKYSDSYLNYTGAVTATPSGLGPMKMLTIIPMMIGNGSFTERKLF